MKEEHTISFGTHKHSIIQCKSVLRFSGTYKHFLSVLKKWLPPLFRGSNFGQPEVVRICKELICKQNQRPAPSAEPADTNSSRRGCGPSDCFRDFFDSLPLPVGFIPAGNWEPIWENAWRDRSSDMATAGGSRKKQRCLETHFIARPPPAHRVRFPRSGDALCL